MEEVGQSVPPPGGLECELNVLYKAHAPGLFRYAALLRADAAQGALHETFLRYFKARSQGQKIPNPQAWLFRAIRNLLVEDARTAGNHPEMALGAAGETCGRGPDPEPVCRRAELLARARAVLGAREMACIRLRAEGLSYEDIAEVLDLRVGAVGALLARTHRQVEGILNPAEGTPQGHFPSLPEGSPYAP